MWVFLLLLAVVGILFLLFIISVVKITYTICTKYIASKLLAFVISLFPLSLIALGLYIDTTNAITFDIYVALIILLVVFTMWCIEKIAKTEIKNSIKYFTGLIIGAFVMMYSYYSAYHVVETNYQIETNKEIGNKGFRIVQIADSHIGTTMNGKKFSKYMEQINQLKPDVVVLTGDFVDDNSKKDEMIEAAKGLGLLKATYGVFFVYGNHDKGYYNKRDFNQQDLENALQENHVIILEDAVIPVNQNIVLVGRQDKEVTNRKSAEELTNNINKKQYIIMLDHQPNDYQNEQNSGADLVLSGHTHGGQTFPLGQLGVLLKANDFLYGKTKRGETSFIVTSGISDWALKFKLGTKSEYVVIDVMKTK